MTVAEFISLLEQLPQDYELIIDGADLYDDEDQWVINDGAQEIIYNIHY